MHEKIRLGLYLYTPMIGGAEQYFKDLLWNIDREQFEVTAFYEPWNEFVEFLDLPHAPETRLCPIKVREIGGHYGAKELTDAHAPKQLHWWEKQLLRATKIQKKLPLPLLKIPGRIVRALMQYGLMAINVLRLRAAFKKYPVEVLHVINGGYPGAQSAQLAAWIAKRHGCRVAVMSVCNIPASHHFPKSYERFLDKLVQKSFDYLIIPGDFIGKLLVELRGFSSEQLKTIPEGVARPEQYGAVLMKIEHARHQKTPTLIMVAGFLPHKGHRFLLEALARLRPEFPEIHATLVGDGPTLGAMRELADRLGISSAVNVTGFRPLKEMLEIMAAANIFVHPSLMEGMPYVILHAMSLGKPVIATPIGGIPEVVLNEQTGLLVPAGDITALTNSIRTFLTNPNRIQEMGEAGRKRYDENYTIDVMVRRHEALYQSLYSSTTALKKP